MKHDYYYYDPQKIDLSVLRKDAAKTAAGDERNAPAVATIHYHDSEISCKGKTHERVVPSEHLELGSIQLDEAKFKVWTAEEDLV